MRRWTIYKETVPLNTDVSVDIEGPDTDGEIEVMPIPDDAAVERVAEWIAERFGDGAADYAYWLRDAQAVLAALEDQ